MLQDYPIVVLYHRHPFAGYYPTADSLQFRSQASPVFCSSVSVHKRHSKNGVRPGLIHHVNDVRWTQGGCEVEGKGDQPQKQHTGSSVQAFYRSSGLKTVWSKLLTFKVYSLQIWILAPPLHPTQVHSRDQWDQAFPVLCCLLLREHKPKNKEQGRPGNRAKMDAYELMYID